MGFIADDMAEMHQRLNGDVLTDLRLADNVELVADASGTVWVNVDGVCALRIQAVNHVNVDTTGLIPERKTVSA